MRLSWGNSLLPSAARRRRVPGPYGAFTKLPYSNRLAFSYAAQLSGTLMVDAVDKKSFLLVSLTGLIGGIAAMSIPPWVTGHRPR